MNDDARVLVQQLPTTAGVAMIAAGVGSLIGTVLLYGSDRESGELLREAVGDAARRFQSNVVGRLVVGAVLSVLLILVGVFVTRRTWPSAPRHGFAVVTGVLVALGVAPVAWAGIFAISEIFFAR